MASEHGSARSAMAGEVLLTLPAELEFVRVAARTVEELGNAFSFPVKTWRALVLACEEVVAYVARHSGPRHQISLSCRNEIYCMVLEITLPADGFDPRMFNLTQRVSLGSDDEMEDLGLLLAARMVDEVAFARDGGMLRLVLRKLRPYPRLERVPPTALPSSGQWTLHPLTPDGLALLSQLTASTASAPAFMAYPGRLIDMMAAGEVDGVVAQAPSGQVVGGGLWQRGEQVVEFFGPYCLPDHPGLAEAVVEACLVAEARGAMLGVICRHPAPGFPAASFERIGELVSSDGGTINPIYFRQLHEDPGAVVWTAPEVEEFLKKTYWDLGFARQLMRPDDRGQQLERHSVISATTSRESGLAVLRPSLPGADAADNVVRHCRHLEKSGFDNLLCEVDLGVSWQLGFCAGLLAAGFTPRFVVPHGGVRDVLVFQRLGGGVGA